MSDSTSTPKTEQVSANNPENLYGCKDDLLKRPAPEGYLEEWKTTLENLQDEVREDVVSLLIFRLHDEWLAMPAGVFVEALETKPVHRIPHRSNQVLLGLTNVRGGLQLCFSLGKLLNIEDIDGSEHALSRRIYSRFVVVSEEGKNWVFPADEIYGVQSILKRDLNDAPVTVAISSHPFTKKVFEFRDYTVGLLDAELIFYKLNKDIL